MGCVKGRPICAPSDFLVGGASSHLLNLAFGNGAREARWSALPPGDEVSDQRNVGPRLFRAPGTYVVAFRHGAAMTELKVTVTP